jgi:pimeloyl-ACP methyl ester carboxylesterase
MPYHLVKCSLMIGLSLNCTFFAGCAVVRVSPQATRVSLIEQRESTLTRQRLSDASLSVLAMTGQNQDDCLSQLDPCIARLNAVPQLLSEQHLSTLSELYLSRATQLQQQFLPCITALNTPPAPHHLQIQLRSATPHTSAQSADIVSRQRAQCYAPTQAALLSSIRYAYAYLMYSNRPAAARLFDNRQVQVRDFYNVAVSRLISQRFEQLTQNQPASVDLNQPILIGSQRLSLHIKSPSLHRFALPEALVSANELGFSGLRAINRRDGFGVEFVAILPKSTTTTTAQQPTPATDPTIHPSRFLPITLVMKIRGNDLHSVLNSADFDLDIYNPYDEEQINLGNDTSTLAANFSAPYGLWLAKTDLARMAYRNLLGIEKQTAGAQLYQLEPYNPDKRVVILIHGLASSPEAWISLTNDVLGDPILRAHYQVWQVFYPTNMPMLESRYQIEQLLQRTYRQVDPTGHDRASQQSVLIGHSMGAVIGRLLVSPTDLRRTALQQLAANDRKRLLNIAMINARFTLHPLPNIGRAVFVSAPFQGTDYADRWFTRAIRRVIQLPAHFIQGIDTTIQRARLDAGLLDRVGQAGLLAFQNGPSELSQQSVFMRLTKPVKIKQGLPYHLMMGQQDPALNTSDASDGIVPYHSSHIEGAVSEKIITGGHSIQDTPEAVLELRRILRLHLTQLGDINSTPTP